MVTLNWFWVWMWVCPRWTPLLPKGNWDIYQLRDTTLENWWLDNLNTVPPQPFLPTITFTLQMLYRLHRYIRWCNVSSLHYFVMLVPLIHLCDIIPLYSVMFCAKSAFAEMYSTEFKRCVEGPQVGLWQLLHMAEGSGRGLLLPDGLCGGVGTGSSFQTSTEWFPFSLRAVTQKGLTSMNLLLYRRWNCVYSLFKRCSTPVVKSVFKYNLKEKFLDGITGHSIHSNDFIIK